MTGRIPVCVHASDPILRTGLAAALRGQPGLLVVEQAAIDPEVVGVVAAEVMDEEVTAGLRRLHGRGCRRVVLVLSKVDSVDLPAAVDLGVCAVLRRAEAGAERLADVVGRAARGEAALPPEMLARLLKQVARMQRNLLSPHGAGFTGLSRREAEVLRLVSQGLETKDIAARLSYSERTVKNVLHDVTSRFHLKNRSHAVAYAMREGLI
ncbi:response regulator transcription factor [Crossiella cryophila]|uniref:DNA-binding NarL/FixJ family response regulator n=1 Tax=Crossiella cryophila TaxID=43355 RepID=A0A7W7FW90_9PSEU|nr:response regulator transcription factor [Crossiella cryophila]MBB4680017.1 DNA-binding NarL/FixJ family response regulator [Crossiella cryophila]